MAETTSIDTTVELESADLNTKTRVLGSQELLMLPRQYSLSKSTFPPMSHVSTAILSSTPSKGELVAALTEAISCHPLLRAKISGSGEPEKRIDLLNMVREGEPDLETFVSSTLSDSELKTFVEDEEMLNVVSYDSTEDFESGWKERFRYLLDHGPYSKNILWSVELHTSSQSNECALIFVFNHAISDQSSANLLLDSLLTKLGGSSKAQPASIEKIPLSLEESLLGENNIFQKARFEGGIKSVKVVKYVAGKAAEGFKNPVILPDNFKPKDDNAFLNALSTIFGKAAGGEDTVTEDENNDGDAAPEASGRKSTLSFRTLSPEDAKKLIQACRSKGVTMSNALTAAAGLAASKVISGGDDNGDKKSRNYKILQSLDMRRFHDKDKCETLSCQAGSMDLMLGPIRDFSSVDPFWTLALESNKQTKDFIESDGPENAARVFDFAMQLADMNNLVHLTAISKASQGRAYSVGVTNAGVYEKQLGQVTGDKKKRKTLQSKHGEYEIKNLHFASSHARSGSLYQFSCVTLNDEIQFTFHPASPIVSKETNEIFADSLIEILKSATKTAKSQAQGDMMKKAVTPIAALTAVSAAVALHGNAWMDFYQNIMQMKQNLEAAGNFEDFWPAVNFWIFFAVGHPILQPILWISDVLHGSPGPMVGDLVPLSFLIGNVVVLGALAFSKELQAAVNILAVSAFIAYVGAGLDGQAGTGDYQLGVNDDYQGKVFKGCPTYEEVRQPSMNDFDLNKYQGLWYEHKFHDWTQFKEVYDTTLDIKLTPDGKGWIDDFGVKGPAPDSAPLSWDKSPVANGAHYFLFGRVDENDPPGVLREKGFGVEFPNYIVDVQKNAETGEYTEAIQFQCLERGGVRVFEGINFMSRNSEMTEQEMKAMHSRAEKAGMYPYGASEDQMHTVARRPVDAPPIDNSWQAMWRAIGVDKLLELLTESIEDGGR